jgi:hypothetical protein
MTALSLTQSCGTAPTDDPYHQPESPLMQTLTLNITRQAVASDIRPGTAILHPVTSRPVIVDEVSITFNDLRLMLRIPGSPRRRSVVVGLETVVTVLPSCDEVERLVHALAVAHRGDVGDDWRFQVEADPLDPEQDVTVYDVYDTGQDVGVLETPLPADLLPRTKANTTEVAVEFEADGLNG